MKAEIVAIGTEILLGQITDTNSAYLAARLSDLGIDCYWISQVGDNVGRLAEVLARAWDRSDLVVATGGLGPTEDDVTREAIAQMLGEEMTVAPELEGALRERYQRRGVEMPARNLKQATLIPSARAIANPRGTAPGWWVERDGRILIAMPGVRAEMYRMWEEEVAPRLRERTGETVILSRTLKTAGIGEALVDEMLGSLLSSTNPTIGVYAKQDGVHVRLTVKASNRAEAEALLAQLEPRVRAVFGNGIWAVDEETVESVVGQLLRERNLTLATMESCTGGLLAAAITDVPGSSGYFKGGLVAYFGETKVAWGVDADLLAREGTVSPLVAEAMAQAARVRLGADLGLAVTGVAGPDPLEGKPVGTVYLAVAGPEGVRSTGSGFYPPSRSEIKQRAAMNALHLLRRYLLGQE